MQKTIYLIYTIVILIPIASAGFQPQASLPPSQDTHRLLADGPAVAQQDQDHHGDHQHSQDGETASGQSTHNHELDEHQESTSNHALESEEHAHAAREDVHGDLSVSEHDHSQHHMEAQGIWKGVRFAGKFHPMVIHFPIALILMAAFVEFLFIIKNDSTYRAFALFTIDLAALATVIAVALGWSAGAFADYSEPLASTLWYHRWLGTATGLSIFLTWYLSRILRTRKLAAPSMAYHVTLFISAVLVGLTGHVGAILVYGWNYFFE